MGRWFPNRRKGTREQVREFDRAQAAQNRNAEQERRAGVREETARYHELNHRTNVTLRPLSGFQRSMFAHDMRTTASELRERRAQRKTRRAGRAR
jgi:hypothetical protein